MHQRALVWLSMIYYGPAPARADGQSALQADAGLHEHCWRRYSVVNIARSPEFAPDADRGQPIALLSRGEKERALERAFLGLYRWYVARSQTTRNWNPDLAFDWRSLRKDHSADVVSLMEGFFGVEQYVPDYTTKIIALVRPSYGRTYFQLNWGAEEERHALLWENAVLFSGQRTPEYVEHYKFALRSKEWRLPWEDPLHMICYTVFQERATQLNYQNLGRIAQGQSELAACAADADPVLAKICATIAADEAAHYAFFLEGVRLYLYYFPAETLEAILDVINNFAMPAQEIIPNWDEISEAIYRTGVYGPRQYAKNVLLPVFENLSITGRKAIEEGIKKSRAIPDAEGRMRDTAIWTAFNPAGVEADVIRLHERIAGFEAQIGVDEIYPTTFVPNPDWPTS